MRAAERRHLSAVAALGCIICGGPAEIHHITGGKSLSRKASDYEAIPLCHPHHRTGGHGVAVHAGVKTWEAKFGTQRELLRRVMLDLYGTETPPDNE